MLYSFFNAWDRIEAMNPFGVNHFTDFFIEYHIDPALCSDIDSNLFLDLMIPRQRNVRRIKIEDRVSKRVFWVYVDIQWHQVSFQSTPLSPFVQSATIDPSPNDLIRVILAFYHQQPYRCTKRKMEVRPTRKQ